MSLDENIQYDAKNQSDGELIDSHNRLTPYGIKYIEKEIVPLLEEALEKGDSAMEIYRKLHPAAKKYLNKKYHWEIMNLNGTKKI